MARCQNCKKIGSLCVSETDNRTAAVREDRNEGMRMLQEGMSKWLGELLQKNNENLSQKIEEGVSERMARELRFLFRQQEEKEEEAAVEEAAETETVEAE